VSLGDMLIASWRCQNRSIYESKLQLFEGVGKKQYIPEREKMEIII